MLEKRLIPCLTLLNDSLVKTVNFKNPKYVGDPINTIKIFNEKFVDEIMIIDIGATKQEKKPNFKLLSDIASECFIPLGYGGGIKNISDASTIIEIGFEKVCLQSSIINNFKLINDISKKFGSQSCLVSIDLKKDFFGNYYIYNYISNSYYKNIKIENFIQELIKNGTGEIIINIVNKDGKREGMDLKIVKKLSQKFSIPIIFIGGIGNIGHIKSAYKSGANALGGGSFFVLHGEHKAVLVSYPNEKDYKLNYE